MYDLSIFVVVCQKMACGATLTLKRNCVDFEPMHCRPAKRQRCSLTNSPLTGHTSTAHTQPHKSAFSDAMPRLTNGINKSEAISALVLSWCVSHHSLDIIYLTDFTVSDRKDLWPIKYCLSGQNYGELYTK